VSPGSCSSPTSQRTTPPTNPWEGRMPSQKVKLPSHPPRSMESSPVGHMDIGGTAL